LPDIKTDSDSLGKREKHSTLRRTSLSDEKQGVLANMIFQLAEKTNNDLKGNNVS
jgi:hypothetical protein